MCAQVSARRLGDSSVVKLRAWWEGYFLTLWSPLLMDRKALKSMISSNFHIDIFLT